MKKEDIEKLMGIEQTVEVKEEDTIPLIVPVPNTTERNIQTVKCPKCQTKFKADLNKGIKCPKCGLEGKS